MLPDASICKLAVKKVVTVEEEEVVAVNKPLSLLVSTKEQRLIWDKTTYVGISAPYNRRNGTAMEYTAFKYTNGRIRSGTQLWFI